MRSRKHNDWDDQHGDGRRKRVYQAIKPLERAPTSIHVPVAPPLPANKCSLELDYNHWASFEPVLSIWLADCPRLMLEYLDEAAGGVSTGGKGEGVQGQGGWGWGVQGQAAKGVSTGVGKNGGGRSRQPRERTAGWGAGRGKRTRQQEG